MRTSILILSVIGLTMYLPVSEYQKKQPGVKADQERISGLSDDRFVSREAPAYSLSAVSFTQSGRCLLFQINLGESPWETSGNRKLMYSLIAFYCSIYKNPGIAFHNCSDTDLFFTTTTLMSLPDKTYVSLKRKTKMTLGPVTLSVYE